MQAAMLRAALLGCLLAAATAPAPPIARAGNATRARRRLSVDYQEVDEEWLWPLTLVSLLAALATNRAINASTPRRMQDE